MTPILMYHSISSGAAWRFRPFTVRSECFENHARYLRDQGYHALTVSDLVRGRQAGLGSVPRKAVVLTFDDGFADFHAAALPILVKYGLAATLYVVSGYIGGTSRWLDRQGAGSRPLLSWSQLAEIKTSGIEIGSHSVSHAALDILPVSRAKEEIQQSRYQLQDKLGAEINSFAYPYGYYSKPVRDLVMSAGYISACAVRYAVSPPTDDRFALRRHIVRHDADAAYLEALLTNRATGLRTAFDRARSASWACLRHVLHGGCQLAGVHHG